ncbi:uncharacterized protein SPPG_06287 [Spizellomyces punctatus DAOM BR117]|uniref:DUF1764 domain-containing protein n=1 Tax=Spizellomyces punctatus (strain DAOM BR117) TaxID=645134 RepID=A0A0L0HCF2_SPIPD|nr:uncharacterized protein SPPG_06287 [Spizellomyces punctatus DAOM BR117]KNC98606.1 hypothetical protein SPPG_06287 [Spizellomyces punctatus DAOM BR117]|eukprot:XP_016606646.1 hypothetical protein SPPG_06287 [Spizellomyces punctatus DAOM BR117]
MPAPNSSTVGTNAIPSLTNTAAKRKAGNEIDDIFSGKKAKPSSEIDDIFSGKGPKPASAVSVEALVKKKKKAKKKNQERKLDDGDISKEATGDVTEGPITKGKEDDLQLETFEHLTDETDIAAKVIEARSQRPKPVVETIQFSVPDFKSSQQRPVAEDDGFGDSRGLKAKRRTEDGYSLFTTEELNIGKGGDTPQCPFECWCCF